VEQKILLSLEIHGLCEFLWQVSAVQLWLCIVGICRRFDGRVQEEIQQYHESEHGHDGVRQKHIVVIILTYIICGTISIISESAPWSIACSGD